MQSIIGLGYTLLASTLWPCIAFVVPQRAMATAFGLIAAIQNLGLAVLFISAGAILDWTGYAALEVYFIAFLLG